MVTAWFAVDPGDDTRCQARALAATVVAAKCTFLQPNQDDCGWLATVMHGAPIDHVCIALALPASAVTELSKISCMLDAVREHAADGSLFAVGVAEQPTAWEKLPLRAYVSAEEIGRVSLQVFDTLASLMAPGLTCALDLDDLECVLGSAEEPTLIEQATYLASERRLDISDKAGRCSPKRDG